MAQDGDTITYTYNGGQNPDAVRQSEDISSITQITIEYIDGAGGESSTSDGGYGGRVEDVGVDVSNADTLYIWVATTPYSRYQGGLETDGGGSSEVAFVPTDQSDSNDEPFLAGAGGGGAGYTSTAFFSVAGNGGARGGSGRESGSGTPPPQGGGGAPVDGTAEDGDGAVENRSEILDSGTTIKGGGSAPDTNGEIRITYSGEPLLSPPDPPSNLSAEVQ